MPLKSIALSLFFIIVSTPFFAQKITLSGTISDAESNEALIGVSILISDLDKGTITNEYGFYSITIPEGIHEINYSYIGYESNTIQLNLKADKNVNITLNKSTQTLKEVIVESTPKQFKIEAPEMSVNKLSIKTIKDLPAVLGEVDIIKSLIQLPGVTTAGEGAAGFNVRGGSVDQNLILLDEATLFSSSHLFGLFSIFNPDAIKDLKLYKGGIPSRFGGRIASVLDIYQKEGNNKKFHVKGGIGLVSSRLLLEGPIAKEKTSFILGGRSSYVHLFLPIFDINSKALFYDLNLKLKHILDDTNKLYLSTYLGNDIFELDGQFFNQYGNRFINLRWNHTFNNNLFSNASVIYTKYNYQLDLDFIGFTWNSGISNLNFKYDLVNYLKDNITIRYGTNQLYYNFNPGKIAPNRDDSAIREEQLTKKFAIESGYYTEAEIDLTDKLTMNAGLRLSTFFRLGQKNIFQYANDQAVVYNENLGIYEEAVEIGFTSVSRKKITKSFINLEPRLSFSYSLNKNTAFKTSYQRTAQYIHLISNTTSPTPLDIWEPSGQFVKPQLSNQYAIGYFQNLHENTYSFSLETYYKDIKNRINYIDGANIIANKAIERVLLNGIGRSYGLELLFQKNEGRFKGWFSYTLSRTEQQIKGRTPIEPGINNGKWFVNNFDKTHDLSLTTTYNLSKKFKVNAAFNFQTGLPVTFPSNQFEPLDGIIVPEFEERNSSRLPNYHRLDLSLNYTPKPTSPKRWKSEWVLSVYNLYNRKNATNISFGFNNETFRNEATRLAIFGVVPSITYNFNF
ncbi:TonB-dependent receptor [Aquimarina agarilytica]|uniref:TonB-dependent receptor n=1 Tax=Aquimarina agarilytica TaxID=1087449 RepID=UPI00028895C9|nr:TonB-dependent receptor [Aquimarina agarilytica]